MLFINKVTRQTTMIDHPGYNVELLAMDENDTVWEEYKIWKMLKRV